MYKVEDEYIICSLLISVGNPHLFKLPNWIYFFSIFGKYRRRLILERVASFYYVISLHSDNAANLKYIKIIVKKKVLLVFFKIPIYAGVYAKKLTKCKVLPFHLVMSSHIRRSMVSGN